MRARLAEIWRDDSAQDAAEYALLLVLIAAVIVVAVSSFRGAIENAFNKGTNQLNQ